MRSYPVLASDWVTFTENNRDALKVVGGIAVNDKIMPFWNKRNRVWLFEGGRGGGKSEGVFDRLIRNCCEDKYFNCYYGRKVWDTVHDTCFDTLVACIRKQGKEHLFKFSEADNSTMIIRCLHNGNRFQPFGASNPESLKSIKDPSHIVCEEFDQFDLKDFQDLFPTLRTQKASCEFIAMYNSWGVLPDHWINLLFFPELYAGKDKIQFDAMKGMNVEKVFINYTDNYFINQPEYEQTLRLASAGNEAIFEALANGARGVIENGNPWLHAFRDSGAPRSHIAPTPLPFMERYPVYLFFDINADPLTCTAWQMSNAPGGIGAFLHGIREFGGHVKVDDICSQIKTAFPASILYVGGDRSGQNQDVGRNQTIYQMIQSLLGLSDKQMLLHDSNLEHADSRILCNAIFYHYPIMLDPCMKNLIADCRKATCDPKSVKGSQLLKDRQKGYQMDYFDSMRYMMQRLFLNYIKETYIAILSKNK
jgi:hypothetical protein